MPLPQGLLHAFQRVLGLCQLALEFGALGDFLLQGIVDLRQVIGRRLDAVFEFFGFLQRLGHVASLQVRGDFLLEHRMDHAEFSRRLLHRVLNGGILVQRAL